MAIGNVVTTVLDVGQGQSTFTCVYDDSTPAKIIHTLLFDCGTDKESVNTETNIDYIASRLALMDTPTLDLLVFSHSDRDHISLMYFVLKAYAARTTVPLAIKDTWYAGSSFFYTKNSFNILNYLHNYCTSFTTPAFNGTQFNKADGTWKSIIWTDDPVAPNIYVGMLIGNVIDDEPGFFFRTGFGTIAELKNRVSIVCALIHGDQSVLICGDATNRTMAWVNDAFGTRMLAKNLMVTVPHHGSRSTGLSVASGNAANDRAIDVVKDFVKVANAKTATISSFQKHSHPSLELVNYFLPTLATGEVVDDENLVDGHFSLFNVDIGLIHAATSASVPRGYHTFTTKANVYTTYYYGGLPGFSYQFTGTTVSAAASFIRTGASWVSQHACWSFVTSGTGGNSMSGYKYMPRTSDNRFAGPGAIPTTVAADVTGHGPILDTESRSLRSADVVFGEAQSTAPPHMSTPAHPATPISPPVLSAAVLSTRVVGAGAARRLRTFR